MLFLILTLAKLLGVWLILGFGLGCAIGKILRD